MIGDAAYTRSWIPTFYFNALSLSMSRGSHDRKVAMLMQCSVNAIPFS
jgi:hypothetical protein